MATKINFRRVVVIALMSFLFFGASVQGANASQLSDEIQKALQFRDLWRKEDSILMPRRDKPRLSKQESEKHSQKAQEYFKQAEAILEKVEKTSKDKYQAGMAAYYLSALYEEYQCASKCQQYCKLLLEKYPGLKLPMLKIGGTRLIQFEVYRRLGNAYWMCNDRAKAATAFFDSLLSADNSGQAFFAWVGIVKFSPVLAIEKYRNEILSKSMQKRLAAARNNAEIKVIFGPIKVKNDREFTLTYLVANKTKEDIRNLELGLCCVPQTDSLTAAQLHPDCSRLGNVEITSLKAGATFSGEVDLNIGRHGNLLKKAWVIVPKLWPVDSQVALKKRCWLEPALIDIQYNPEVFKNSSLCPAGYYKPIFFEKFDTHLQVIFLSTDGCRLVCVNGQKNIIRILDAKTGKVVKEIKPEFDWGYFWSGVYAPNGKFIALGNNRGQVLVFDAKSFELIKKIRVEKDWNVYIVAVSPDSKMLAASVGGGLVKLVDIESGSKKILGGHIKPVMVTRDGDEIRPRFETLIFSKNGKYLLGINSKYLWCFWELPGAKLKKQVKQRAFVSCIFDDNNILFIKGMWRGKIFSASVENEIIEEIDAPDIFYDKDSIFGNSDRRYNRYPNLRSYFFSEFVPITGITIISDNGETAATYNRGGWIGLWDFKTKRVFQVLPPMGGRLGYIAGGGYFMKFTPDGKRLMVVYQNGVAMWRVVVDKS